MLRNYFKLAIRNLLKQRGLAFINIFGLSVGLACFCLFMLYAINEFSYDRFHKKEQNIYRVFDLRTSDGNEAKASVSMPMPLGPAMKKDLPGIVDYVRIRQASGESILRVKNDMHWIKLSYADSQIFSVFSFPMIHGNSQEVFKNINGLVITETKAIELFGKSNALGEIVEIKIDNEFKPFEITGIAKDISANSSIVFEAIGDFRFMQTTRFGTNFNNWYTDAFRTFIQLEPASKLADDKQLLQQFYTSYNPPDEKSAQKTPTATYGLQQLRAIHTDPKLSDSSGVESVDPKTIWIILAIAFGVLLIACINFTTLAIGRSADRGKEVGVRKVLGAERRQVIIQFLTEALIVTIGSALIGLLLLKLLLPYFNSLTGKHLKFSFALYPELGWWLAGLIAAVGLLAGSYPALVLSGFKSIDVLKNKIRIGGSNFFTKSLVTLQFAMSFGLIASTIIILQQTKYISSKNPGFNRENVIVLDASQTDAKKIYPLIKQALSAQPAIAGITAAQTGIGEGANLLDHGFKYNDTKKRIYEFMIDPDYINVLGMQLIAGRNFNPAIAGDTINSVIINESMAKDFGWAPEEAINQQIKGYTNTKTPVVIGVVKDFNFQSLSKKVLPHLFHQFGGRPSKIFIRIKPGNPEPVLATIQQAWTQVAPDAPLRYSFLDEDLNNFYKSERRWSSIVGWAGGISVFLACLGLFGLAALAALNRSKEIGIRKVLGASLPSIIKLLSKDFIKLVTIALVIATPAAWYFMNNWLQDFAYRISISWWVFILTGLFSIAIALITIGFQAIKAAISNPVKSLRTE